MGRCLRLFTFVIVFAAAPPAAGDTAAAESVHVRIHDYASMDAGTIARIEQLVGQIYAAIGVPIVWLDSSRPLLDNPPKPCAPTDLALIVITQNMAMRRLLPEPVVGFAAVTREEGGRVAFIVHERVRAIGRRAQVADERVMAMVMAHELGHLLLPYGSHSDHGLMRAEWVADELRDMSAHDLRFTVPQADAIRQMLTTAPDVAP